MVFPLVHGSGVVNTSTAAPFPTTSKSHRISRDAMRMQP
jgi:hypothetical protein